MPEACWFKLCGHGDVVHGCGCCVVYCFGFGRWDVADRFEQASVVEPVDPFQCCELDGFERAPGSAPGYYFGLVETVNGFGEALS